MNMYAKVNIDKSLADKMLHGREITDGKDVKNYENSLKAGNKTFLGSDNAVIVKADGDITRRAGLLHAVSNTGITATVLISFKHPSIIRDNYPEIFKQYENVITPQLKAAIKGESNVPFLIDITPEIASALMLLNANNRGLYQNVVNQYAASMRANDWHGSNATMITIGPDGVITNGQHRLEASIIEDYTMENMVVQGCVEYNADMDNGRKKTMRDNYKILTGESASSMDATNLLYRIIADEHMSPSSNVAIALYEKYKAVLHKYECFTAKKLDFPINASYRTAFLALHLSGMFSDELLIKVHKFLNESVPTDTPFDMRLADFRRNVVKKKGVFNLGPSSAASQKNRTLYYLAFIISILTGKMNFTGKSEANIKKGVKAATEFVENACGKDVRKIIAENSN